MARSPEAVGEILESIREIEGKLEEPVSTPLDEQAAAIRSCMEFMERDANNIRWVSCGPRTCGACAW